MGLTYVDGVVTGPFGLSRSVDFLVDSGAKYSLLPIDAWRAIGLAPERRLTFVLADGTGIERDVTECYIRLPQGKGHTPVILGEPGDEALLGVVTLEILGLILHPSTARSSPPECSSPESRRPCSDKPDESGATRRRSRS